MKTPLKENISFISGGVLKNLIPSDGTVDSFLLYGGNIEFALANSGRHVRAHTNNYLVHEFWDCVLTDSVAVAVWTQSLASLLDDDPVFSTEKMFCILQESWHGYPNPYTRAGLFFLLNRHSDSGRVSSGKMVPEGFNSFSTLQLRRFNVKNLNLVLDKHSKFFDGIGDISETDLLLFPVGKFSYNLFEEGKSKGIEETTVDHKNLFNKLKNQDHRWVVLYKKHPAVFEMYKEFNVRMVDQYGRLTDKEAKCEELVIANF